jgi:hypothetical protein
MKRMEVVGDREGMETSSGGFRRDFRTTVTEDSAPGVDLAFLLRGRRFLGRIYYVFQT